MKINKLVDLKKYNPENILLITDNDLDGIVGGIFFTEIFPFAKWIYTRKDILSEYLEDGTIYNYDVVVMIDCSPKTLDIYNMLNLTLNNKLFIIDHHISSLNISKLTNQEYNIDTKYCGAYLTYLLSDMKTERHQSLAYKVNNYDLWLSDDKYFLDASMLNKIFNYMGIEDFIKNTRLYLKGDIESILTDDDERGFYKYAKQENEYVDMKVKQAYINKEIGITFAEKLKSEIGNSILTRNPSVKVAIIVDIAGNSLSLRSNGTGLAIEYASRIGCNYGGHPDSAGCRMENKMEIIKSIISTK